jgi:hypothetical protein
MPGLDSQLQKNSVAGSEAAGSGHDQEVAAITSFSAEVLPISSSKRSNKVQAKLELCSSNEKVDDSLRSSSRPAKPVVKGKRNLQEPEEVNDGSQVQVLPMPPIALYSWCNLDPELNLSQMTNLLRICNFVLEGCCYGCGGSVAGNQTNQAFRAWCCNNT